MIDHASLLDVVPCIPDAPMSPAAIWRLMPKPRPDIVDLIQTLRDWHDEDARMLLHRDYTTGKVCYQWRGGKAEAPPEITSPGYRLQAIWPTFRAPAEAATSRAPEADLRAGGRALSQGAGS